MGREALASPSRAAPIMGILLCLLGAEFRQIGIKALILRVDGVLGASWVALGDSSVRESACNAGDLQETQL